MLQCVMWAVSVDGCDIYKEWQPPLQLTNCIPSCPPICVIKLSHPNTFITSLSSLFVYFALTTPIFPWRNLSFTQVCPSRNSCLHIKVNLRLGSFISRYALDQFWEAATKRYELTPDWVVCIHHDQVRVGFICAHHQITWLKLSAPYITHKALMVLSIHLNNIRQYVQKWPVTISSPNIKVNSQFTAWTHPAHLHYYQHHKVRSSLTLCGF